MAHSAVLMIFKNLKVSYNALASVKKINGKQRQAPASNFSCYFHVVKTKKYFQEEVLAKTKITEWAFIDIFGLSVDGYSMKKSKCLSL